MNEWIEVTGKTVEDAIIEAGIMLSLSMENLEYEIVEKESSGFLGLNKKPAKIRARQKAEDRHPAEVFLSKVFDAMNIKAGTELSFDEAENTLDVNITGDEMGILIGKRGQTLDSLQYLVSLVVNKGNDSYVKVKLDTENYRERRKETLENLAKNLANKVRRTRHSVALEPMNPYERRIIHSVLQGNKYVETHSEGEEPYRKVIVTLKKGVRDYGNERYYSKSSYGNKTGSTYGRNGGHSGYKKYEKKDYKKSGDSSYEAAGASSEVSSGE